MCHLQKLYEKYRSAGLVVLGFNSSDQKEIALKFLRDNAATFPNIIDGSTAAEMIGWAYKATGVPLNYIIDRKGKIVDAWFGYETGHPRTLRALRKLGIISQETQPAK